MLRCNTLSVTQPFRGNPISILIIGCSIRGTWQQSSCDRRRRIAAWSSCTQCATSPRPRPPSPSSSLSPLSPHIHTTHTHTHSHPQTHANARSLTSPTEIFQLSRGEVPQPPGHNGHNGWTLTGDQKSNFETRRHTDKQTERKKGGEGGGLPPESLLLILLPYGR